MPEQNLNFIINGSSLSVDKESIFINEAKQRQNTPANAFQI